MSLSRAAKTLIQGAQDAGETIAQYPVLVGGRVSSEVLRALRVTDDGRLEVVPVSSSGGVQQVQGAAAAGAAVSGNPVLLGVSDGTNAQAWAQIPDSVAGSVGVPAVGLMVRNASSDLAVALQPLSNTGDEILGGSVLAVGTWSYDPTADQWDRNRRMAGAQANAWSAASTGAGGTSGALDCDQLPHVSAFGNVSAATTLTLQMSQDGTNWYDSGYTIVIAGAGNFGQTWQVGAKHVRLKSSADVTATVTLAAKG